AKVALEEGPADLDALKERSSDGTRIADVIISQPGKIGEKIEVSSYEVIEAEKVVAYIHSNYRLGVLVGLSADVEGADDGGRDVAMQIAAMNPTAIDKDGVDATLVERELEIAKEQLRAEGKPEAMLD